MRTDPWPLMPGVVEFDDGRRVRGRALDRAPAEGLVPTHTYYLTGRQPRPAPWPSSWVQWPDFSVPRHPAQGAAALTQAFERAADERVELVCSGGKGRTGTAIACLAVLAGTRPEAAVAWARDHYDPRAVETPWQRAFVRWFARHASSTPQPIDKWATK